TFVGATGKSNVLTGRATAATATTLTDALANFLTFEDKANGLAGLTVEIVGAALGGLVDSATGATLTDTAGNFPVSGPAGLLAGSTGDVTAGPGAGQKRTIVSNSATGLTVDTAWTTPPDGTSRYLIRAAGASPVGQKRVIASNTQTTLTLDRAWAVAPN